VSHIPKVTFLSSETKTYRFFAEQLRDCLGSLVEIEGYSLETRLPERIEGYSQALQVLNLAPGGPWIGYFDRTSPAVFLQGLNRRELETYYRAVLGRLTFRWECLRLFPARSIVQRGCPQLKAYGRPHELHSGTRALPH
jgi:hypothetical protein